MMKATPRGGANSLRTLKMTHPSAVEDGEIVVSNGQVLIACAKLAANKDGAYIFRGPVEFAKGAETFAVGDTLYWDNLAGVTTATAEGNTRIGICIALATPETDIVLADLEPMVDVPGNGNEVVRSFSEDLLAGRVKPFPELILVQGVESMTPGADVFATFGYAVCDPFAYDPDYGDPYWGFTPETCEIVDFGVANQAYPYSDAVPLFDFSFCGLFDELITDCNLLDEGADSYVLTVPNTHPFYQMELTEGQFKVVLGDDENNGERTRISTYANCVMLSKDENSSTFRFWASITDRERIIAYPIIMKGVGGEANGAPRSNVQVRCRLTDPDNARKIYWP